MIQKALAPILDKDSYSVAIEKEIEFFFYDLIFRPLFEFLEEQNDRSNSVENSKSSLKAALKSGRVQYVDGYFTGQFNAAVSKDLRSLDGRFDSAKKAFKLPLSKLPIDLRQIIADAAQQNIAAVTEVNKIVERIQEAQKSLTYKIGFGDQLSPVFSDLDKQFKRTTADDLTVTPELPKRFREKIAQEYTDNMNLYIKNWTEEEIVRLRDKVEKNTMEGFRAERLKSVIVSEFGQAKNKAKFLARQETSLLVSKYRQTRYEDAGVQAYKWDTSHDVRVRPDHKELNGRIFTWDNPPITDRATGARNNPGEDFGCRCVAIPILRTLKK